VPIRVTVIFIAVELPGGDLVIRRFCRPLLPDERKINRYTFNPKPTAERRQQRRIENERLRSLT